MPPIDRAAVEAFWRRYASSVGEPELSVPAMVGPFGDSVELADELLELVLHGPKRATAGSVAEYEADGSPLPFEGMRSVITDGRGRPRAVLVTTEARVAPMSSVDDRFAWDEGEGDRSRAYWVEAHERYFRRTFAARGWDYHPEIPVVFERFELAYFEPEA